MIYFFDIISSVLNNFFGGFIMFMLCRSLSQFLAEPVSIIGIIFITAGIALAFLSKRLTRAIHHTDDVANDDKMYNILKISGLILVGLGFFFIAINVIIYLASK